MSSFLAPVLKMVKSNHGKVVALTAIVASLAIGYTLLRKNPSKRKGDPSLAPALTETEAVAVMNAVMDRVKRLTVATMDNAKKIKNDIEAQGHQVDNEMLRQTYILPNFEKGFEDIQTFVFNEFEVEESEVEDAVTYYSKAGNLELRKINDNIRKVFKMFGADVDDEAEEDDEEEEDYEDIDVDKEEGEEEDEEEDGALNEDDVLSILEILALKMVDHTNNYAEEFKRKYGLPNKPDLMDAFLEGITTLSEEAEKLVLISAEVTHEEFQQAFHDCKARGSVKIDNAVRKMKMDNQALLRAQGIMV